MEERWVFSIKKASPIISKSSVIPRGFDESGAMSWPCG